MREAVRVGVRGGGGRGWVGCVGMRAAAGGGTAAGLSLRVGGMPPTRRPPPSACVDGCGRRARGVRGDVPRETYMQRAQIQ